MSSREAAVVEFVGRVEFAVPINRAVLRDQRLSFGARGVFCFIWDLPAGWKLRLSHLAGMSPDGRDAIRSRLRELERVGAVEIEPIRDANTGRVSGKRWIVFAPELWAKDSGLKPSYATEERVSRTSEKSYFGETNGKGLLGCAKANIKVEASSAEPAAMAEKSDQRKLRPHASGIECWYLSDELAASKLTAEYSPEELVAAIAAAVTAGKNPVPGTVKKYLKDAAKTKADLIAREAHAQQIAAQDAEHNFPIPTEKQIEMLPAVQRRLISARMNRLTAPENSGKALLDRH